MKLLRMILWSGLFSAAVSFVSVGQTAYAGDAEQPKCDASGKPCKEGKDCKPENCKKDSKKEEKK